MKIPWKLMRYLPAATRLLRDGRLPHLLRRLADKKVPQGARFSALREDLRLLRGLCLAWLRGYYRQVSSQTLLVVVAALLYFIAPLDAVPDWLLAIGLVDDLAVLAWVLRTGRDELDAFRLWRTAQVPEQLALIESLPPPQQAGVSKN